MPKIIENLESKLITEAKLQIQTCGYSAMTIRSVAKACGVGVGTVYNYFSSKDELLAAYLLEDWNQCIAIIQDTALHSDSACTTIHCIYDQLISYAARHQAIFKDPSAASGFAGAFSRYHSLLRQQLAQPLEKFCKEAFLGEFIAESLLTWTMSGKSFEDLYGIIGKLF